MGMTERWGRGLAAEILPLQMGSVALRDARATLAGRMQMVTELMAIRVHTKVIRGRGQRRNRRNRLSTVALLSPEQARRLLEQP